MTDEPADKTVKLDLDATRFRSALADSDRLARGFASNLSRAFVDLTVRGKSFGDVLSDMALRLSRLALTSSLKPFTRGFADLFGGLSKGFAGLFAGGASGGAATGAPTNLLPFAKGGVIGAPSYFPLGNGLGLAGERGAEAILPLARGPDGGLGVRAEGGARPVTVTFNVTTPDVEGFRRSEAELAAALARIVARGARGS
jgi:phage-related minor tail protein